ncbi:MAG: TetR/AcrR family transcriptional regulator [Deltaproteobacteria bacterium]|nr:TetR/AcrR family transcriptional regulator [Deltaproteobacteria bacterium]
MTLSSRAPSTPRLRRPRKQSSAVALPRDGKEEPTSSRRTVIEEHLLDVAAKQFASTGYRQTTLEEIARHAGIAKASMYRYFENKQELLAKIFVKVATTFTTSLQPILTTTLPPEEKLRRAVRHLLHTIGENVSFFTVFYSEEGDLPSKLRAEVMETRQRLAANLESILLEGMEHGSFRALDAKLIVYAIVGMCGWLHKWYGTGEARLEDVTTAFVSLIEHGCLATRGTEAQAGLTDRLRHVQDLLGSAIGQAERLEKNVQPGRRS